MRTKSKRSPAAKQSAAVRKPWHHHLKKRWWIMIGCILAALTVLWFVADWASSAFTPARQHYTFGTSFSQQQAQNLGLDWKANFTALLDDMKIRQFRLMSYWDSGEKMPGKYDFTDLDWQMDQAAKRGAKVSLAIGLRQPRWPECHQPHWADKLSTDQRNTALNRYVSAVVKRYEHHPALESWQLENEAYADWFGTCEPVIRQRITDEFNMIRKITHKPLLMSLSDQYGYPISQPLADGFGYSVYRVVYDHRGPGFYVTFSTPIWYHKLRAAILGAIWHKPLFVHELQLEPWGPLDTKNLSIAEQNKSMSVEQIHNNLYVARQIGFDDVYTWGSEWWYWRKEKLHDPSIWNAVKQEVDSSRN